MRLAFCGKGGSGKSTLSALFSRFLSQQGFPVLAIDADINQHMGAALGLSNKLIADMPKLGMQPDLLKRLVKGENAHLKAEGHIIESTPAGTGSGFFTSSEPEAFYQFYTRNIENIRFMAVGGHDDHDVGTTCFHKYTGALGIFLNHLLDQKNDFVIGDMCAGADPFASSGLASRFDAIILVVEPTLKSTAVYHQCVEYAAPFQIPLWVVGNKITDAEDEAFIQNIVGTAYLGGFTHSKYVRQFEKGLFHPLSDLEKENFKLLELIYQQAILLERDWKKYQKIGTIFHQRAAEGWANASFGYDLMSQIDPDFSYEKLISFLEIAS